MKRIKCPICEKVFLVRKKIREEILGVYLGDFSADVCIKCGESFTDSETTKIVEEAAKRNGIWGLGMKTKNVDREI